MNKMRGSTNSLDKYGEVLRYDPTFKGPLKGRSCTDVICLLLFIIFLVGWGAIAWYALSQGDINKLIVPIDSNGKKCGVDPGYENRKFLFFFDLSKCADLITPISGCNTPQVCVEKCPETYFYYSDDDDYKKFNIEKLLNKTICKDNYDKYKITTKDQYDNAINNEYCAKYYLRGDTFLNRCISGLPPGECPYIPKKYVEQRTARRPRDISFVNEMLSRNITIESQKKSLVVEETCTEQRIIGTEIVKRKVKTSDTYFTRVVENFLIHFVDRKSANEVAQVVVLDIQNTYHEILLGLVLSMFICLIFIFLMRWIASPIVWLSLIGSIALLGFSVYFSAKKYVELRDNNETETTSNGLPLNISSFFKQQLAKSTTWLVILILLSIVLAIILLVVIFLRKRIVLAIALIKEGSKAVSSITASVFFPILPWLLQIGVIAFAIVVGLFLASVGNMSYKVSDLTEQCKCDNTINKYINGEMCDPVQFRKDCHKSDITGCIATCNFKGIDNPNIISYMQAYNVVGFLWVAFFISAFGQMVLASTFATWYWTFHKSEVPFFTVLTGMGRTVRYHLGTVAFGSLIVTICRIIRIIIEYIDRKCKKYDNEITKAIICCLKCFFWCLEKFLKFLSKNAYIMCAIHGNNFCVSARDAFNLLMRNVLRVFALDKVTDFLFFLSKVMISLLMGACVYCYYEYGFSKEDITYKFVPIIFVAIGTFLIATLFFNVYSMAVDTLFLCFLEDCERNDGSEEKPYFMSKALMKILGKRNELNRSDYSRGK